MSSEAAGGNSEMKLRFGIPENNKDFSGTELYIRILQISALLPIPYFFAVVGYPAIITKANVLSFLFDAGMMAIPRFWSLLLSFIYRISSSEVLVTALLLVPAFICGIVFKKLLREKSGKRTAAGGSAATDLSIPAACKNTALNTRRVLAVLIILDLIFRVIPLSFNLTFGIPALIIGFVVRACCLVLVILDLRAAKKQETAERM